MSHRTVADRDCVVAALTPQRRATVAIDREPHRGAVCPRRHRGTHLHDGVGQPGRAPQRVAHHLGLPLQLRPRLDVLPVAATAPLRQRRARRRDAVFRWFDHPYQPGSSEVALGLHHHGLHAFAGQGTGHEHHPAVGEVGQPVAAGDEPFDLEADGG